MTVMLSKIERYTNPHLKRVELQKERILYLRSILKRGDYIAAGLTIGVNLGPLKEDEDILTMECAAFTQEILELLIKSLEDSVKFQTQYARKDYEELAKYFTVKGDTK